MAQNNVMEICLFELSLHMTQVSAQICCFAQRLLCCISMTS